MQVTIENLSHDGRGIAHIDGKTTFIHGALPEEIVEIAIIKKHRNYDEGKLLQIISASSHRIEPQCPHANLCGGCSLQHLDPENQLALKEKTFLEQLQHFAKVMPDDLLPPITALSYGYRRKARLSVKYLQTKDMLLVGFHEKNSRYLAHMNECSILHPPLNSLITPLKDLLHSLACKQHIPQIEVAIPEEIEPALVIRHLVAFNESDLQKLVNFAKEYNVRIYSQSGGINSIELLYPQETDPLLFYRLQAYDLKLFFMPTDFTQINWEINNKMIARAVELLAVNSSDNVLDLFCGIGNFSLPLARYAKNVIGVEGSSPAIDRAQMNAAHNQITNASFYHADLTKENAAAPWKKNHYDKILLDPPRTGALEMLPAIGFLAAKNIVYISCNPATFARDAGILVHQYNYRLSKAGIMDMFPHTSHVEAMALFTKE